MKDFLKSYEMQNVTIYSKCNSTIDGYTPPGSKLIQMPNIGRCDHSNANWMANMIEEDATDNHIVLFIKASRYHVNHPGMVYRSLKDMIRIANVNGFACGYDGNGVYYHNTAYMRGFAVWNYKGVRVKSAHTNFGHWLDNMGIKLPEPVSPVCYGGNFAVKAKQIYAKKSQTKMMEQSLTRGDSIEEGHFAERTWAGLLSYPLDSNQTDILQSIPTVTHQAQIGYVGYLRISGR